MRPEILAPAGDRAALEAAVRAGADAVYFGLAGFNARARAANFDAASLGETLRFLHEHGRRGYVTLNTLVFDDELAALEATVRGCAEAGVDAVIVQDLGVARLVRAIAPSLPMHASTQMTCTDAGAVELARELGCTRVILARELTLDQIAAIRRSTDVEVEVFVHGALCISYSGQCLTSEAIGGRSANRGACAQACRLPYELVVDGQLRPVEDRAYLLSPEDLEASALVPRLVALGVSSLKIEGRLKGPAYVAATTRLYRQARDAALSESPAPSEASRRAALQTYSRGSGPGFLDGIDHQRLVEGRSCDHRGVEVGVCGGVERGWLRVTPTSDLKRGDGIIVEGGWAGQGEVGGRVWDLRDGSVWLGPDVRLPDGLAGRRVFKNSDQAPPPSHDPSMTRRPLSLRVSGRIGERPLFVASCDGVEARVEGDAALEPAHSTPVDETDLRDKLGGLGDTPFVLADLTLDWPAGAMVPLSSLKRARRALVAALLEKCQRHHATTTVTHRDLLAAARVSESRNAPPSGLFVLCRNLRQAEAALAAGADGVYIDFLELTGTGDALRSLRAAGAKNLGVAPPRIRKPGEEKIDRFLQSLAPDALLVRGLGALGESSAALRVGDFSLNVTNRLAAAEVLGRGLHAFTPSFDLDSAQLCALLDGDLAPFAEVIVHHPMPLFHMEHCVIAALLSNGRDHLSCGRPCDRHQVSLRDRAGMDHPVEADVGCRNTVFHASAQSAADLVPRLVERGVGRFRIELVRESADDVRRLVAAYRRLLSGENRPAELWRSLKVDAGYGVVRGSLRVLSQ